MNNAVVQPSKIDTDTIDNISIKLISTLNRNDLVHILLDMVEPRVMLENIVTTKREQNRLEGVVAVSGVDSTSVGGRYKKLVCFECKEIHDKLLEILHAYNLEVGDIV